MEQPSIDKSLTPRTCLSCLCVVVCLLMPASVHAQSLQQGRAPSAQARKKEPSCSASGAGSATLPRSCSPSGLIELHGSNGDELAYQKLNLPRGPTLVAQPNGGPFWFEGAKLGVLGRERSWTMQLCATTRVGDKGDCTSPLFVNTAVSITSALNDPPNTLLDVQWTRTHLTYILIWHKDQHALDQQTFYRSTPFTLSKR